MRRDVRYVVLPESDGMQLVNLLLSRFGYHDQATWRCACADGRVTRNGSPVAAEATVAAGDILAYDVSGLPEPPVDAAVGIVYEDDSLLVLDKPGNLPTHPAGRYFNHTLWGWLRERGHERPAFINRLDRETSGLVLVGRNAVMAAACHAQFARREVTKRYLALVEGRFPDACQADGWLEAAPGAAVFARRRFVPAAPDRVQPAAAESASTHFRRLGGCGGLSLVAAEPLTGRRHQIRATLHSLGYPVVGDKLYGPDETIFLRFREGRLTGADRQRLRMGRQALHAAGLSFRHPADGRPMNMELRMPADMQGVLDGNGQEQCA